MEEQEKKLQDKYGKLPTKTDMMKKRPGGPAKKQAFDSADWAASLQFNAAKKPEGETKQ
jgi:hypothetical protein